MRRLLHRLHPAACALLRGTDEAHTVAEAAVALALLVGVLLPAGTFMGSLMTARQGGDYAAALRQAQTVLEQTLAEESYGTAAWTSADHRWHVERKAYRQHGLVFLTVHVRRSAGRRPLVTLTTARRP